MFKDCFILHGAKGRGRKLIKASLDKLNSNNEFAEFADLNQFKTAIRSISF